MSHDVASARRNAGGTPVFYALWAVAATTYILGDGLVTLALLQADVGFVESNVVVRLLLETIGGTGFLGYKGGVMVLAVVASAWLASEPRDRFVQYAPPVCFAVAGLGATVYNLGLVW